MKQKTIKDIAAKTGVSCPQVSRALNGVPGVSDATAKKVLKAAAEIGYMPNELARSLVRKRSTNIAFLANDITNPNTADISHDIVYTAHQYGYQTFLGSCDWDHHLQKAQITSMIHNRVAGILLTPATDDYTDYLSISVPVVCINSMVSGKFSNVVADNVGGVFKATEYLIRAGYKKIGFIGGAAFSLSDKTRLQGYLKALDANGITVDPDIIHHGSYSIESGYCLAKQLLESPKPPDAVICANDTIALGVQKYCVEKGVNIPEQLGIFGFDDNFVASLPQVSLSSVTVANAEPIGVCATKLLIHQIENGQKIEHLTLETALVIRGSTRKAF